MASIKTNHLDACELVLQQTHRSNISSRCDTTMYLGTEVTKQVCALGSAH